MIEVKIIADSISREDKRITTFVLTYPRFIHAEFMTHRVFSRNASSSRAIPVKKQIQMVIDNPAIPLAFTRNQKGMQGGEALDGKAHELAVRTWLHARDRAVNFANDLADLEVHKQYANRLLEPFAHITVVCTATDFDNFFALRTHKDAQPEINELAQQMYKAYKKSKPQLLNPGEWHLPFITEDDYTDTITALMGVMVPNQQEMQQLLLKRSVAKCARVSYLTHEGKASTLEQDLDLYDRLLASQPLHASPAEHQATPGPADERSGNFTGWIQYRKTLSNENIVNFTEYLDDLSRDKLSEYTVRSKV